MNKIIDYLKCYLLFFILFIIYFILISPFIYFEIININIINIVNYIIMLIYMFILGYKISHITRKRGYLNGFLISLVLIFIFMILSLTITKLSFSSLVYYLSLIVSSIIGGIIGVQK